MFKSKNKLLTIQILSLICIGIYIVGSSSKIWAEAKFNDETFFMHRQLMFALPGLFVMWLCSKIRIDTIRKNYKLLLFISMIAMILVLIPGVGIQRNGSRSWFGVGSFLVQPSEFLKLSLIFYVAEELSKKYRIKSLIKDLGKIIIMSGFGFGLIMLQPDFGSGMVMMCTIVVMVIAADTSISYFVKGAILAGIGMIGLIISAPYRLARITSFIDPWSDPLGAGFQMIQSLFAISPGGLLGRGIDGSIQKHFYLPEPQTDFIFAVFAEEFGFIGCVFLILLYISIIYQGMRIALQARDSYHCYLAIGLISLFAIQVLINLGVVVGLFPVTGEML